jgi:Nickel responsive protein SCO4226-like
MTHRPRRYETTTPSPRVKAMKKYIIEREIPGIGSASRADLAGASKKSNAVLAELAPKVKWVESFVADNKTFCVYMAENEAVIKEHAAKSGFPATKITEIKTMMNPATADEQ